MSNISPMTGKDLVKLREMLGEELGRPLTLMDFPYELGIHRARFTEMCKRGEQPLVKPRVEILAHLLQAYPKWAISAQDRRLAANALELMNSVRPNENYTLRELAILLGYEVTASLPWSTDKKTIPTTNRILRLIVRGLRQDHEKDRELFMRTLESIVAGVANAYGIDQDQLRTSGFAGFRQKRKEMLGLDDGGED